MQDVSREVLKKTRMQDVAGLKKERKSTDSLSFLDMPSLYLFESLSQLMLNPVSSVRYFEFDFVHRHLSISNNFRLLDVSSPYLFGLYIEENYDVDYLYINPDPVSSKGLST